MSDQATLLPDQHEADPQGPAEYLWMIFQNDKDWRKHFLEKLR
jgi:hypothetical protein